MDIDVLWGERQFFVMTVHVGQDPLRDEEGSSRVMRFWDNGDAYCLPVVGVCLVRVVAINIDALHTVVRRLQIAIGAFAARVLQSDVTSRSVGDYTCFLGLDAGVIGWKSIRRAGETRGGL